MPPPKQDSEFCEGQGEITMRKVPALFLIIFGLLLSQITEGKGVKILTNHIGYETTGPKHAGKG
jgi:hypothetical protein